MILSRWQQITRECFGFFPFHFEWPNAMKSAIMDDHQFGYITILKSKTLYPKPCTTNMKLVAQVVGDDA
jgi:hypothetical protein